MHPRLPFATGPCSRPHPGRARPKPASATTFGRAFSAPGATPSTTASFCSSCWRDRTPPPKPRTSPGFCSTPSARPPASSRPRPDTLRAVAGLGEAAVAAIKTAEALGIRLARTELPARFHPQLATYEKVIDYCRTLTAHREVEELHLLFLDNRNALIRDERHQRGTLNHTPAYPREICIRALEVGAAALVILHNHPSGDPTPSRSDVEMTNRIRDALKPIDVTLHDHVVVTAGAAFSFREKGLI